MRIALVDGDTLAFRSAASAEERSILVKHLKSGREKEFKNRTEFKEFLANKGFEYVEEDYEIRDVQDLLPFSFCKHTINLQVEKIKDKLGTDKVEIYVGGQGNFRENLELPKRYKGNRESMLRPLALDKAKQYVLDTYDGGLVTGYEADDELHIRAMEILQDGNEPILCTQDKDARQGFGLKIYNWCDDSPVEEIDPFGYVRWDATKKKVIGAGLKWLAFQVLFGDPTDNYKPVDLCNDKFGQQSALKLLKDCQTPSEVFDAVREQYNKWYPEEVSYTTWDGKRVSKTSKELLDMYFRCAYMLRYRNDTTTFDSLEKEMT